MDLARAVYLVTEEFPKSETFGLRMQLRRSGISVASNIAEGHGRLTDVQLKNSLGLARGHLYELETQLELAHDMRFINDEAEQRLLDLGIEVAKLINGLLGVLDPEERKEKG